MSINEKNLQVVNSWINQGILKLPLDPTLEQVKKALGKTQALAKIIKYIHTSEFKYGTVRNHYTALAALVEDPELASIYSTTSTDMTNVIKEKEKNNELDEKELKYFKTHDWLVNRLTEMEKEAEKGYKQHMAYLLATMYINMPPIRLEYMDMPVKNAGNGDDIPLGTNYNYIWVDGMSHGQVIIVKDKVSKHYGPISLQLNHNIANLIQESLEKYPRKYLICAQSHQDKPASKKYYYDLLRMISERMGVQLLRASYITHYYNSNPSLKGKEDLAKKMRHSVSISTLCYNKVLNYNNNNEQ